MQSIFQSFKGSYRRFGLVGSGVQHHAFTENRPPLFSRKSPWWVRWTYVLIAGDLFMTTSAVELTWNYWTEPVTVGVEEEKAKQPTEPPSEPSLTEYIPKKVWERGGVCIAHITFGVAMAAALLIARLRHTRTLDILPPLASNPARRGRGDPRRVFVQTGRDRNNMGSVYPLNKCSLQKGRSDDELILRVKDERGHWFIGLDQPVINGQPSSVYDARDAIIKAWGKGKIIGVLAQPPMIDGRWKSGPVV